MSERSDTGINPFMVLNEMASGLKQLNDTDEKLKARFLQLLDVVRGEYEEVVKNEVQRAISSDEDAIKRLCSNYIDHIKLTLKKKRSRILTLVKMSSLMSV